MPEIRPTEADRERAASVCPERCDNGWDRAQEWNVVTRAWTPRCRRCRRCSPFAALLAAVRREAVEAERERCAKATEAELAKLQGRWSLDSAYLSQAIAAIRAGEAEHGA